MHVATQTIPKTNQSIFSLSSAKEFRRAGPSDLISLLPVPGDHSLVLPKKYLMLLTSAITGHEIMHISGPTGTCKSGLIEALHLEPRNFELLCGHLGFKYKPLRLFTIEMSVYESPSEFHQRRALKNGNTLDEESGLIDAIRAAAECAGTCYPLIWLREMGRVHSPSVQGGLLNLVYKGDIVLPDKSHVSGKDIAWIADSNYQAEQDSTHTLVTFDDALKRRFTVHMKVAYLPPEQEVLVMRHIINENNFEGSSAKSQAQLYEMIDRAVTIGQQIRSRRAQGDLVSACPPTIYGYLGFIRMALRSPELSQLEHAKNTLLGNVSEDEEDHVTAILNEVFGLQAQLEDEPTMGGNII